MKLFSKVLLVSTLLMCLMPMTCIAGAVTKDGYYNGIKLCGKVKVKRVTSFPDKIGEWQFVDAFPDFTIQFVDAFPDIKIQYVNSFPGVQ